MRQWRQLLNLFFESPCPLCQRLTGEVLCSYCNARLQLCKLPPSQTLEKSPLLVFSWGKYGGELRRAIAAFKYENQPTLGEPLGRSLGESWNKMVSYSPWLRAIAQSTSCSAQALIAVPIPMHREKLKKRGFNQAELIAESFCKATGIRLERHGLSRIRETQAQFQLSAQEREKNLTAAFQVHSQWVKRSPKAKVLLIDDIYTTGATVRSATQALRVVGIEVLGVAVVARPQSPQSKTMKSGFEY